MELVKGSTSPEVWLAAAEHVASQPRAEDFDVFLHVAEPTVLSKEDRLVHDTVDNFLKFHGKFGLNTVAETIFPLDTYVHEGARAVFDDYPSKIRSIQKSRSDGNWGSYAYRLLRQEDLAGNHFNPLEDLVNKIRNHGKYRASFELSLGRPFEGDLPIYDPATDRKRLYGGPCLSHLSVKVDDGKVRINATYRSHYYIERLLGNLIGIGRLQYFIAREARLKVGGLTINSTFARIDSGRGKDGGWTKTQAEALIKSCRAVYDTAAAAA